MDDSDGSNSLASRPVYLTAPATDHIYDQTFWLMYLANCVLVTANVMTFRFAELVHHLNGTEQLAGTIVSVGVFAALTVRLFLGQAIDRYGARRIWIAGAVAFVTGCALFIGLESLTWPIYVARALFAIGLAVIFTCSTVKILHHVPPHRRTEALGNLGSSGFVGFIIGSQAADWVFYATPNADECFRWLFGGATLLGAVNLLTVAYLSRNDTHIRPAETPSAIRLVWRHWPGIVALVGLTMGLAFTTTSVFLTRFATFHELRGIGTFFTVYAVSAFFFRILAGRWCHTIGRHRMILAGLAGHGIGMCLLPSVRSELGFLLPAMFSGFGHAQLFPAVVSLGTERFPKEYHGTGATLVLGLFEFGGIVFAPLMGSVIDAFDGVGFSQMYYSSAAFVFVVGLVYWIGAPAHDTTMATIALETAASDAPSDSNWLDSAAASRMENVDSDQPLRPELVTAES
ncbi:MAG: MFS transporter [Planctomycetota bacterium]|nr:MFS transporter [Planctomycetota bacterium]